MLVKKDLKPGFIGKDEQNNDLTIDFNKTTNNIFGGGTCASGKSVFLHTLKRALSETYGDKVSFILIDPKMVEFDKYKDEKNVTIIKNDDDLRLEIDNLIKISDKRLKEKKEHNPIFVFHDEVSHIFDEKLIADIYNLAMFSKETNIRFVLLTQLPSFGFSKAYDVINFDTRICFRTLNEKDSESILGHSGGELLNGQGDCIIKNSDQKEVRAQIAYCR